MGNKAVTVCEVEKNIVRHNVDRAIKIQNVENFPGLRETIAVNYFVPFKLQINRTISVFSLSMLKASSLGSVSNSILFNVFISDLDTERKECLLN